MQVMVGKELDNIAKKNRRTVENRIQNTEIKYTKNEAAMQKDDIHKTDQTTNVTKPKILLLADEKRKNFQNLFNTSFPKSNFKVFSVIKPNASLLQIIDDTKSNITALCKHDYASNYSRNKEGKSGKFLRKNLSESIDSITNRNVVVVGCPF